MINFKTHDDFETFDIILDKVKNYKKGEKLYYVRFGDGDLIMMYPESEGKVIGRANQFNTTKEIQNELYRTWNIQDDKYMVAGSLNLSSPFSTDHGIEMHNKVTQLINSGQIIERKEFYSHPTFESNFIFKPDKFSSRVLASRLWDLGINKIVLDIGSVVDMFIANTEILGLINTRSTMETYKNEISKSLEYILDKLKK
jgi:hypothetical protein